MRLAEGIVIDSEKTFGLLKFSALRRESKEVDSDGNLTTTVISRTYDLKCKEQGCMIQVTIPATASKKEYAYNTAVELVNPLVNTVANADYMGVNVDWYIKADDIISKKETVKIPPMKSDNKKD